MSETHRPAWEKPLDPSLYVLDDEEKAFMKVATGIQDDDELKTHVLAIQTKAFEVSMHIPSLPRRLTVSDGAPQLFQYPCLRMFDFLRYCPCYAPVPAAVGVRRLADRGDSETDLEWRVCRRMITLLSWESNGKGLYCSTWDAAVRITNALLPLVHRANVFRAPQLELRSAKLSWTGGR